METVLRLLLRGEIVMGKRRKGQESKSAELVENGPRSVSDSGFKTTSGLDVVLLMLAGIGILLTSYLTYVAWFETHAAFCSEGSGCDLVQASRWATLLGMPMAFWGWLTYVMLAAVIWRAQKKSGSWTAVVFLAVCGFAISAYLTTVSVLEIEATCPYCLASFAIMTTIMILTLVRQPPNWSTSLKEALVIAALLVGGLHLHYSGVFDAAAGPEDPQLQALAIHLADKGVKFYGAYWCPRCQQQKAVFEASAKRLPYVECSSGGRGSALTKACAVENVKSYPTWIIGERRLTGLQTPPSLATATGFDWKE
jgi:uncharacterized membrane protein